jgi:hypothetical protein
MKTEEVLFVSQCECCDYVSIEFDCPVCEKFNLDHDSGWMQDEVYNGRILDFECEKCKSILLLSYNKEEYEYQVTLK